MIVLSLARASSRLLLRNVFASQLRPDPLQRLDARRQRVLARLNLDGEEVDQGLALFIGEVDDRLPRLPLSEGQQTWPDMPPAAARSKMTRIGRWETSSFLAAF